MNKYLLGGAVAAILAGGTALAATTETPTTGTLAKPAQTARHVRAAQTVTRAEVQARMAAAFAKLDTNHDGFISKDELSTIEAQRQQKAQQRAQAFDPSKIFDRMDANHDGKITVAEVNALRAKRAQAKGAQAAPAQSTGFKGLMAVADTNKDGVLTRAEFETMGQQLKGRMEKASVARGGMATRMFDMEDTNKDGKVTLAEMQQAALGRFDRVDLNHDGTITPQERQQAAQMFKAQRQAKTPAAKH